MQHSIRSLSAAWMLLMAVAAGAQDEWGKSNFNILWQGLRGGQPAAELPVGKAAVQMPRRVPKKQHYSQPMTAGPNEWILTDGWELGTSTQAIEAERSIFDPDFDTREWYDAAVPGTVLTTLVAQGVYPEPTFGLNNRAIPDTLCRMDWWYRTEFDRPAATVGNRLRLRFNGINYRAEVFLNGRKLGNVDGAFIRAEYDITHLVHERSNVLAVLVHPPHNPGFPHEQSMAAGQGLNGGQLSLDGPTFIASMGWDWIPGIRDRNMGIWQDVRLIAGGDVAIGDPHVVSNLPLPDTTRAMLTITVPVRNLTDRTVEGALHVRFDRINLQQPYTLAPSQEKTLVFDPTHHPTLDLRNPRLWWPNGYGAQHLYRLDLQADVAGQRADTRTLRFGIRELSYELMIHTPQRGNHRVLYTPVDARSNGKPVFNYEKVMPAVDTRSLEAIPTLAEGVDASAVVQPLPEGDPLGQFIVFRVNGRRIFIKGATWGMSEMMKRDTRESMEAFFRLERDANFNTIRNWTGENTQEMFYELADEYGLLVWNDFWITTDDTVDPNDHQLFLRNATDVVRRFRTHPSIAIWCPRNEGYAPTGLEPLLHRMVAHEDPSRHYHGNSRFLNMTNSGPYGFIKNPADYYTRFARGFNTELGAQSIPTAQTIRKFIAPEDQWPINDVWAYHDLHHKSHFFGDFIAAVNSYGQPDGLDDFARKAQQVSYDTWRTIIESYNGKMWQQTSGLILWMSHPSWPSMTWQTHTYDFETPGAYFGVRKAQEPLHIQWNLADRQAVVVNHTSTAYQGAVATVTAFGLDGKQCYTRSLKTNLAPNRTTALFAIDTPKDAPELCLVRLELKDRRGQTRSVNDYWHNGGNTAANRLMSDLPTVGLQIALHPVAKQTDSYHVEVRNPSTTTIAVAVKLNAYRQGTDQMLLPANFSDGYFNLLPGETRRISLAMPAGTGPIDVRADGYNIEPSR